MMPRPATGDLVAEFARIQRVGSDGLGDFQVEVQRPVWAWPTSRP